MRRDSAKFIKLALKRVSAKIFVAPARLIAHRYVGLHQVAPLIKLTLHNCWRRRPNTHAPGSPTLLTVLARPYSNTGRDGDAELVPIFCDDHPAR